MVNHGLPWPVMTMVNHDLPWSITCFGDGHRQPWLALPQRNVNHGTIADHGLPWYTMVEALEMMVAGNGLQSKPFGNGWKW